MGLSFALAITLNLVLDLDLDLFLLGVEMFSSSGRGVSMYPNEISLSLPLWGVSGWQSETGAGGWNNNDDDDGVSFGRGFTSLSSAAED